MKITKILVAISFLFTVIGSANAGELSVTGNMETTYSSSTGSTTGNPLGTDRELKFAGSTELDNGITVSVMQDTGDTLVFGNSQLAFSNSMGTLYIGSDSDPMDSIDDITPSAYEEANGSGSGSYVDIGSAASQMGLGLKYNIPFAGALNVKYYPKVDGAKNADNASSADTNPGVGNATSASLATDLGALTDVLAGAKLTTGITVMENNTGVDMDDTLEMTAALTYAYGPVKLGYQNKYNELGETATNSNLRYRDDIFGIAYAINDSLSISYNNIRSTVSNNSFAGSNALTSVNGTEQKTEALNIGYAIGGMTIGIQTASTDNAGYVVAAEDDSNTIGISVAF